jgi:hypothetical protein
MYIYMYVCMYVIWVCAYVCMYIVCAHVHVCVYTYTHTPLTYKLEVVSLRPQLTR